MQEQFFALFILILLTGYVGSQKKTGIIQWVIIAFLVFVGIIVNGDNKTASVIIFGCLLASFFIKSRRQQGRSIIPFRMPQLPKRSRIENHKADLSPFLNDLTDWEREQHLKTHEELSQTKQRLSTIESEIATLRAENQALREKQADQRRVEEATPRLRHYHNLTRKKLDEETSDLSKLKEKRLREELQRQRDENRELKKNTRR